MTKFYKIWHNQNMKILRINIGLTQKQLGQRVGVSQVYISKIENGDIDGLTVAKIIKLSKVLNVSPTELFDKLIDRKYERRLKLWQ